MRRILLLLFIVNASLLSFPLFAQISEGGNPISKKLALRHDNITITNLPALDMAQIIAEDDVDQKMGNYPKIGRVIPVNFNVQEHAQRTTLHDGSELYRIALRSSDAMGLSLLFENMHIPAGGKLFIYSPDYREVLGAYTQVNNHSSGVFSTELIATDEVIIEYYEPYKSSGLGTFTITGVLHAYRMVPGAQAESSRDFGDSDPCQVNVNCSEGNNWQNQKRGAVRILIFEGSSAGWCSGSLVNNTAQDCSPYILTALHCGENATIANMNQWVFYFNYEATGCSNPSNQNQVPNQTMTGCARIADSNDGGGNTGSDFLLTEINNSIPGSYNVYYNGWSAVNTSSPSGVSIHHPAGDIKKISTYTSSLVSSTWGGISGTHWRVNWSSTTNGFGVTEGGSSGSPIFNSAGLLIGTLTGGSSFCSSPNNPDYYGKMSYHWASNPGDDLRDYLAPGSSATTLAGSSNPCSGGGGDCIAGSVFSTSTQNVCPGETAVFNTSSTPTIPSGGGYAVDFVSNGGTGGVPAFSITSVTLPFEFDNDINGVLSFNNLDPLLGSWTISGYVFTDPNDALNTVCDQTTNSFTVNFLTSGNPLCSGGSGDNDDCSDATTIIPGVYDFSTESATTDGPAQPGSDCDGFGENNLNNDIWFEYTASCNGTASFSTCNTATFDTRVGVYPGGQCPPSAGSLIACNDDGVDCADFSSFLEWNVTSGSTYLIRLGGYSAADSGTGTFDLTETCDSGDCVSNPPYSESDPCFIIVINDDPFCCNDTWDNICQDAYDVCSGIETPCVTWAQPTPTTTWGNFNITYEGAPCNDGSGCPIYGFTDFEVWNSEAYAMDNVIAGGSYTFSHCDGPGAGSWIPDYTIIAPSGAIDAFGAGDGDGCSITWTASETGTYVIVINEEGACGVSGQVDNGYPSITCNGTPLCDVPTAIAENAATTYSLYPNPNKGQFTISYNGTGALADLSIMDVSGRILQTEQVNFGAKSMYQVDLGNNANGIYFVRITQNSNSEVLKVVVQ